MNEVQEIPIQDSPHSHIEGHLCICQPDIYNRYQNGQQIGIVVRHHRHANEQAAVMSTRLTRGY